MAGLLTIHSNGTGELLSGHSWIEYTPDGGKTTTYGTWGNDPTGQGNGLFQDLELGRTSDASRSVRIDDAQEAALNSVVKRYKEAGKEGWRYLSPCSTFAADAWKAATGEGLSHRSGIISNPSKLKKSIENMNAADANAALQPEPSPGPARSSGSLRPMGSAIQPCSRAGGSRRGSSG